MGQEFNSSIEAALSEIYSRMESIEEEEVCSAPPPPAAFGVIDSGGRGRGRGAPLQPVWMTQS